MLNFCFDSLGNYNIGYPNLARPGLSANQFDSTWPRVAPCRLFLYLKNTKTPYGIFLVDDAPANSWYPVALAWHDFDCDYFELMSTVVKHRLRLKEIRVMFYYHEGDNPYRIQQRFDHLCQVHNLPTDCYVFISANSAASNIKNFYYFNDHEWFFSYLNRRQPTDTPRDYKRKYEFVALNRLHKWWRATIMANLHHQQVLDQSIWSYNTLHTTDDLPEDNPLMISEVDGLRNYLDNFLNQGPYWADSNNSNAHNDHRLVNVELYNNAYCHLILETLFDADQSGGAFLTEKTFKAIKYGQPFVIFGTANSLAKLRDQGYRVFDHAIDNRYDTIQDNTARWLAAEHAVKQIKQQNMHNWYMSCLDDIVHNQYHFQQNKNSTLSALIKFLNSQQ